MTERKRKDERRETLDESDGWAKPEIVKEHDSKKEVE